MPLWLLLPPPHSVPAVTGAMQRASPAQTLSQPSGHIRAHRGRSVPSLLRETGKMTKDDHRRSQASCQAGSRIVSMRAAGLQARPTTPRSTRAPTRSSAWSWPGSCLRADYSSLTRGFVYLRRGERVTRRPRRPRSAVRFIRLVDCFLAFPGRVLTPGRMS
jgi:hypothetical protein